MKHFENRKKRIFFEGIATKQTFGNRGERKTKMATQSQFETPHFFFSPLLFDDEWMIIIIIFPIQNQ